MCTSVGQHSHLHSKLQVVHTLCSVEASKCPAFIPILLCDGVFAGMFVLVPNMYRFGRLALFLRGGFLVVCTSMVMGMRYFQKRSFDG